MIGQPVVLGIDSTEQEADVMPQTSKAKQSAAATKYSTPPKSRQDWKKKIYVGGYFGMGFGSTFTNIDVSPIVGYNFTENFNMGIGVIYNYYSYSVPNYIGGGESKISSNNWGGRLNANYTFFKFLSIGAEYQYLTVDWFKGYTDLGAPII
jgi:long-subunit fatty acid transport protein